MHRLIPALAAILFLAAAPDAPTAASGLKEALRVSAANAVRQTARTDGYFGNPELRIAVPEELKPMTRGLRRIGLSRQIEEFELAMNRAAESAAGEAFDVFDTAIGALAFSDARALLGGNETAATDYLRRITSEELGARFAPIVERSMSKVGAVAAYDRLLQHWRALPEATRPQFDLQAYVSGKTLDGLFRVMGREERKIRTDPAARTSELLRRAFSDS
jgi:hypothetical protein